MRVKKASGEWQERKTEKERTREKERAVTSFGGEETTQWISSAFLFSTTAQDGANEVFTWKGKHGDKNKVVFFLSRASQKKRKQKGGRTKK